MVTNILEELRTSLKGIDVTEVSYAERGYHVAIEVTRGSLLRVVNFLDVRGFYLVDLFCIDFVEYLEVVYLFNHHEKLSRLKITIKAEPEKPSVPTISHVYKMAHWYEREVHEFYGVFFEGHPFMTYLFLHDGIDVYPLRKNQVKVSDEDKKLLNSFQPKEDEGTYLVNMGPHHPSTHGVLRVVLKMDGEYILKAEPVLGYLHRMHEKMAENRNYVQFLANTGRMDYMGALAFNLGYVATVEKLTGIEVPERAHYVRTIAVELNRIGSHLLWVGSFLADMGGLTPFFYAFDDRENLLDVLEGITGSRLTYSYFRFGGLFNDIDDTFITGARKFIERMRKRFSMYDALITGNIIFIKRTMGTGIFERDKVRKYGCSGPLARSTGIPFDMRRVEPCAAYGKIDVEIPLGSTGDNLDRYKVRMREMAISLDIIEQALNNLPGGPVKAEKVPKKLKPPKGDIYHAVETPRGELGVYIVSDETDTPYRMRWRVPSFSNLMTLPYLAEGTLLADAVVSLGSLDFVVPEVDR